MVEQKTFDIEGCCSKIHKGTVDTCVYCERDEYQALWHKSQALLHDERCRNSKPDISQAESAHNSQQAIGTADREDDAHG